MHDDDELRVNKVVDVVVDAKFPTSPINLYNLMFDSEWFVNFLTENQKVWDLEFEEWHQREPDTSLLTRNFHYTKPMSSGVGPKEVFCESTEENQHRDENDYIETKTITHTPNVPYGKAFHVITSTHIAWAPNRDEGSVLTVTSEVVWTGWCPFKGLVEGRALDGQKQYANDLDKALRDHLGVSQVRHSVRFADEKTRHYEPEAFPHPRSSGKAELGVVGVESDQPIPRSRLLSHFVPLFLLSLLLTLLVVRLCTT